MHRLMYYDKHVSDAYNSAFHTVVSMRLHQLITRRQTSQIGPGMQTFKPNAGVVILDKI